MGCASCPYDLNDVGASANLHGTSSAHDLCGSDDVCCASDDLRSNCGSDDIRCASSAHDLRSACGTHDIRCASYAYDHINVGSTHDLRSACGYIGFGAGDIIGERAGTDNVCHASYGLRCANCSSDLRCAIGSSHVRCASCPHDLNDVSAS